MKSGIWLLPVMLLVGISVGAPVVRGDSALVGAFTTCNCAAWDSQGIPPNPQNFVHAAEFSLSSTQMVTDIEVVLFGDQGANFTLSLVDSLPFGIADVYTAADLTIVGQNQLALYFLPVNKVLGPATFFLAVTQTAGDLQNVGWDVSNGIFNTTDGAVTNGMWEVAAAHISGPWGFEDNTFGSAAPGVFIVNGPDTATPTPEPGSLTLLGFGLASLTAIRRRVRPM